MFIPGKLRPLASKLCHQATLKYYRVCRYGIRWKSMAVEKSTKVPGQITAVSKPEEHTEAI